MILCFSPGDSADFSFLSGLALVVVSDVEAAVEVVSEVVEEDDENGFLFNSFASDDVEDVVLIEAVSEEPAEDVRRVKGLEGILSSR